MSFLAVFGYVCCILLAVGLAAYTWHKNRQDNRKLEQLKDSELYKDLQAQIASLKRMDIDTIRIECSGVTMTSVCPAHLVMDFSFKQNGNSLRNTGLTRLYAELIAKDFPLFTHQQAYQLHRYTIYRPNGKKERAYAFIMRPSYKDYLMASRTPGVLLSSGQIRAF